MSDNPIVFLDGRVTLHVGDCLAVLKTMDDESVDCVVTSPPYWGLRDYGVDGQIGLELTLEEHIEVLVEIFEEVRRVLKKTGTVWVNYGDTYASKPNGRKAKEIKDLGKDDRGFVDKPFSTVQGVMKPKDLCLAPLKLVIALQAAGWWIRSRCVWGKSNPMPESAKDRPTNAFEEIFLLTKAPRYDYDAEAVRQPSNYEAGSGKTPDGWDTGPGAYGSIHRRGREKGKKPSKNRDGFRGENEGATAYVNQPQVADNGSGKKRGHARAHQGFNKDWDKRSKENQQKNGRNLRNYEEAPVEVWRMATRPFKKAHFATFPIELADRCIKAGCPSGGVVLDIFGGAGSTALAALRLNRKAVLIELNPDYADLSKHRIEQEWREVDIDDDERLPEQDYSYKDTLFEGLEMSPGAEV